MAFALRGQIGMSKRVYELRWDDGEFSGHRLPMERVTLLLAPPPSLVRTIEAGPQIEAGAGTAAQAVTTARACFDRIVAEMGDIPAGSGGERPDDPPNALY